MKHVQPRYVCYLVDSSLPLVFALTLAVVFSLTGCMTVQSTEKFYTARTTDIYPEKPKDFTAPILDRYPDQPYKIIGNLSFSATRGYSYMVKAMRHNARIHGADAVVLKSTDSQQEQYTYYVPGYTTYKPVTTYHSGSVYSSGSSSASADVYGSGGYAYGRASGTSSGSGYYSGTTRTYVPEYHPGYTGIGTRVRISIDADMVVFR